MTLVLKAELPLNGVTQIGVLFSSHALKVEVKSHLEGAGFIEITSSTFWHEFGHIFSRICAT